MCSYVIRMYSYVTYVSLAFTCMTSVCHSYVLVCHPNITRIYLYVIRMPFACKFFIQFNDFHGIMPFVCHSYIIFSYIIRMYLYVTRMSLIFTCMSFVKHSYVLVCHLNVLTRHSYVTRIYLYVIRRIYLYVIHMPSVCHLYVLVCGF